jgi:uncharacterized protein YueI
MKITILKQPIPVFFKDNVGGKKNSLHVQFSCSEHIQTEDIQIILMLFNDKKNMYEQCIDQTILEIQGNIDIFNNKCIDIYFRITRVSYRYNNNPFCICVKVGNLHSVQTDSFYVRSKSRTSAKVDFVKGNTIEQTLQDILKCLQQINHHIISLKSNKNSDKQKENQEEPTMTRNMSLDSFDFV